MKCALQGAAVNSSLKLSMNRLVDVARVFAALGAVDFDARTTLTLISPVQCVRSTSILIKLTHEADQRDENMVT